MVPSSFNCIYELINFHFMIRRVHKQQVLQRGERLYFPECQPGMPLILRKRPASPELAATPYDSTRLFAAESYIGIIKYFRRKLPSRLAAYRPAQSVSKVFRHVRVKKQSPERQQFDTTEIDGTLKHRTERQRCIREIQLTVCVGHLGQSSSSPHAIYTFYMFYTANLETLRARGVCNRIPHLID